MLDFKFNKKHIILIGGFGNNLFQLNEAFHLREAGFKVIIHTYLTSKKSRWLFYVSGLTFHNSGALLDSLQLTEKQNKIKYIRRMNFTLIKSIFASIITPKESKFKYYLDSEINENYLVFLRKKIASVSHLINNNLKGRDVMHIRGGDFIKLGIAMNIDRFENLDFDNLLVVTDDLKHAQELFRDSSDVDIISENPLNDFLIMVYARKLYLSNSTFSWWAAEISESK